METHYIIILESNWLDVFCVASKSNFRILQPEHVLMREQRCQSALPCRQDRLICSRKAKIRHAPAHFFRNFCLSGVMSTALNGSWHWISVCRFETGTSTHWTPKDVVSVSFWLGLDLSENPNWNGHCLRWQIFVGPLKWLPVKMTRRMGTLGVTFIT